MGIVVGTEIQNLCFFARIKYEKYFFSFKPSYHLGSNGGH